MQHQQLVEHIRTVLATIPPHVAVEAAAKTRTADEVQAAVEAGVRIIGYNYVQEAQQIKPQVVGPVQWHLIGHLQKNKVNKAVELFDLIETVDSFELAAALDRRCAAVGKRMPVLIEVNSGREPNKSGALPEEVVGLVRRTAELPNLEVRGLMTMGPLLEDPEAMRPYFRLTREIFLEIKALQIPRVKMEILSMGMSDSYRVAIEEGATLVRLGTLLFGPRRQKV
ncbi:MAG: YggS family pyridoxal phosphate-dependent enzyme [candidate division KSB1 bacterium]|nr:YggS family pyridoxal phosphate-dependent enzyme [candidate division KSB1 bacterium]